MNLLDKIILTKNLNVVKRDEWHKKINVWKKKHPFKYNEGPNLKAQQVIEELNNQIVDKENYIFTTGVGNHQMMTYVLKVLRKI